MTAERTDEVILEPDACADCGHASWEHGDDAPTGNEGDEWCQVSGCDCTGHLPWQGHSNQPYGYCERCDYRHDALGYAPDDAAHNEPPPEGVNRG
jgi:hypothetical protein